MTIIKLILGFLASAFGMIEALIGFAIWRGKYKKAYLFKNKFGFTHPTMIEAYKRPINYHNLKNIWPTWLEIQQERPSKAIALLLLVLLVTNIIQLIGA